MCRALAIAGLAALLAVTGCGSGSKVAPNTVTMVIESSPLSLDPRIGTDAQSEHIDELIFDGLFARAADFTLQPKLATDWSSPGPLDYVIHLRKDVRFHDGRAMTARDVAWTFNSMRDGTVITAKSGAFASVASVTTPDDYTVVIHLKKPDPSVLWNLSDGGFGVVPGGSGKDFAAHPVGTGPFQFVSQKQDDSVDVVRAKISWQPQPSIEGVHFAVVPDATTRALELRKGSADVALNSLTADTIGALKRDTKLRVVATPGTVLAYLAFNLQDPVLRDARVRQAIADGIDREAIIQALMGGYARPAESVLPSNHWAYDQSLPVRRYDPAAAMALLDAAGYKAGPDGVRLHLNMKTSTDEDTRLLAAVLQQQLRKIGIALDLRSYEFATFYSDVVKGAFQMYSLRWIGGNENPDIFRYVFASASVPPKGANRGRYNNPKVDQLIEAANAAPDDAARRVDYVELQQLLATDLPAINLWYRDNVAVMNKRIQGYKASPSGDYSFLETVRISQQ